jgi:hypothetical protein
MSKTYRCPHELDLRKHPRCYLCTPLEVWEGGRGIVIRPTAPGTTETRTTTSAPWCSMCQGYHIPGQGPCRATYS